MGKVYNSGPTNLKQICRLITYTKHVLESYNSCTEPPVDLLHPLSPDEWAQHTSTQMRMPLVQLTLIHRLHSRQLLASWNTNLQELG